MLIMKRVLALTLLCTQLGVLAGPAAVAVLDRHAEPGCEQLMGQFAPGTIRAPLDCDRCDIPGCSAMLACSFVTPAVATVGDIDLDVPLVALARAEASQRESAITLTPFPPPPRT